MIQFTTNLGANYGASRLRLIEALEGLKTQLYVDTGGFVSIGYGLNIGGANQENRDALYAALRISYTTTAGVHAR